MERLYITMALADISQLIENRLAAGGTPLSSTLFQICYLRMASDGKKLFVYGVGKNEKEDDIKVSNISLSSTIFPTILCTCLTICNLFLSF